MHATAITCISCLSNVLIIRINFQKLVTKAFSLGYRRIDTAWRERKYRVVSTYN